MSQSSYQPRIAVNQAATIAHGDSASIACTILDVSGDGFRLRVAAPVPVRGGYTLTIKGEDYPVELRWSLNGEVGGLFIA